MGDAATYERCVKEVGVVTRKRMTLVLGIAAVGALVLAATAGATVTVPTVDPSAYGSTILNNIGSQLTAVLPYAAAFTAFAVGVAFIKGWIGRKKATQVAH